MIQCNYCEKLFIKLLQTFLQSRATFLSNAKLRCDFVRFCHQNGKRIKLESRSEKLCGWKILLLDNLDGERKINWVSSSTFASVRSNLQQTFQYLMFYVWKACSDLLTFSFCNFVIRCRADNKEVKSFIQLFAITLIPSKIPLLRMNEMRSQKLLNFIKLSRTFRLEVFGRLPAINWLQSFIKQRGYKISTRKLEKFIIQIPIFIIILPLESRIMDFCATWKEAK